jgi:hypothetical protein
MPYREPGSNSHLYSVFFAPRGHRRMAQLGVEIAQQYLSPFDQLIGVIGEAGSGKSMLIKGMFPGLELSNDDEGVNVRPLPLLSVGEDEGAFYTAHTYHVDIRFEAGFTQMHVLADAIKEALRLGRRVVVEHFDLVYPLLGQNAQLLIGIGEEVLITRPSIFGPEPGDVANMVFASFPYRRMAHTAEDLCGFLLRKWGKGDKLWHADVRHGFILGFNEDPQIDLDMLEADLNEMIKAGLPVSYCDEGHILIDGERFPCTGPRMHVKNTDEIEAIHIQKQIIKDPTSGRYLLVGTVGKRDAERISELNTLR